MVPSCELDHTDLKLRVCRTPAQVGADIVKRALPYSLKLIANNAGDNGSVVMQVRRRQRFV